MPNRSLRRRPVPSALPKYNFELIMKILRNIALASAVCCVCLSSCLGDNDEDYTQWREDNEAWLAQQVEVKDAQGNPYYEVVTATQWAPGLSVLMHWHNDRALTQNALKPMATSTVSIKYHVSLYDGTPVDSSYNRKDSVLTGQPGGYIPGWTIAVTNMHVGDSCTVIMPPATAYQNVKNGAVKPYSALVYQLKLQAVDAYEIPD